MLGTWQTHAGHVHIKSNLADQVTFHSYLPICIYVGCILYKKQTKKQTNKFKKKRMEMHGKHE